MSASDAALLKSVPAKADGVVVGTADLYDDGSVVLIIDEDAPPEAVAKIKEAERFMSIVDKGPRKDKTNGSPGQE